MQIRYTSKAKKAIDQASKMSKSLHHHYIGTEHILIGLLKEGTGVAAQVLNDNGVELDKVMQLIEELIAPDAQVLTAEAKEYSPRALQVLEGASNLFPWDKIAAHTKIGLLLAQVQYSWRYVGIATVFLVMLACEMISLEKIQAKYSMKNISMVILVISVLQQCL